MGGPRVFTRWAGAAVVFFAVGTAIATPLGAVDTGAIDSGAIDSGAVARSLAIRLTPPPRSVSVIASGDVLTEERVRLAAANAGRASGARFDFGPMFAEVREVIETADLAICHMETPVGAPGGSYGNAGRSPFGGNLIQAPNEVAGALRNVGFDRCSTASNHANDLGPGGIDETIGTLNGVGITTTGTARNEREAAVSVFEVNRVKIAHLSYSTYSNTVVPAEPWRLNYTRNPLRIAADVAAARLAGAEIVLISLHVSAELQTGPTALDRSLVTSLTALAEVNAVFMHGPHVVQPLEIVNGTPVWWSLGNFVSEMGPPSVGRYASARTSDGLLGFVRFVERAQGGFAFTTSSVALCNDFADRTVRSATVGLARSDLSDRERNELATCLARTRELVPAAG